MVFETWVKNPPPARNKEEKAFREEKRGGRRNAEHTVWIHDVLSSGSKAPVGPRLPRGLHDRKLLSLLDFQPEGVVSGPAGVIRWSAVVCSAPFLHARYPVSERSFTYSDFEFGDTSFSMVAPDPLALC